MSRTRPLERKARMLSEKLQLAPRLIYCAGAKEELLAMLERQRSKGGEPGRASAVLRRDRTLLQCEVC